MDRYTKITLNLRNTTYENYLKKLKEYERFIEEEIQHNLNYLKPYYEVIENEFENEIKDIEIIRRNRFIDKVLWIKGSQ